MDKLYLYSAVVVGKMQMDQGYMNPLTRYISFFSFTN